MAIGIALLAIVLLENILFSSIIENSLNEGVNIYILGILNLIIALLISALIYFICKRINNLNISRKVKFVLLSAFIIIYIIAQVLWINYMNASPAGDQLNVYNFAKYLYESNEKNIEDFNYMEKNPHQITISFVWSILFKLFSNTSYKIIQYINAICNGITIIAIMLIIKELSKKYKTNKYLGIVLIGTFISLPLLSTFIYGDFISLSFSLLAVYSIMKYGNTEKIKFVIISAVFMAISYILRMNSLIIIIAICIYLILEIIKNKKKTTEIIKKLLIILCFILITFIPDVIIKNYVIQKYNLNIDEAIPTICYICMGITDGYRQSGWYNGYVNWAWHKPIAEAKVLYKDIVKDRIVEFINNPITMMSFYLRKTASMWTENTYSAVWNNLSFNTGEENANKDNLLTDSKNNISIYQKALIFLIFTLSIIVLVQHRNNLSNELILLLTIFIGGFLFHILWEAKSRYIIPYIIILIPIASIEINKIKIFKSKKMKREKEYKPSELVGKESGIK